VLVVLRFAVDEPDFVARAGDALAALAACRGYQRGQVTRAYDDPAAWCLVTEWESVGAYRRALGSYDVKLRGTPVFAHAVPEPSAFEVLAEAGPDGQVRTTASDRADASTGGSVPGPARVAAGPVDGERGPAAPSDGGPGRIASRP
jgi:hypothetical protein